MAMKLTKIIEKEDKEEDAMIFESFEDEFMRKYEGIYRDEGELMRKYEDESIKKANEFMREYGNEFMRKYFYTGGAIGAFIFGLSAEVLFLTTGMSDGCDVSSFAAASALIAAVSLTGGGAFGSAIGSGIGTIYETLFNKKNRKWFH